MAIIVGKKAPSQMIEWARGRPKKALAGGEEVFVGGVGQELEPVDAGRNEVCGDAVGAAEEVVTDEDTVWCYLLRARNPPTYTVRWYGAEIREYCFSQTMETGDLDAQSFLEFALVMSRVAALERLGEAREVGVEHSVGGR